jgi:hypothetical protein
VARCIHSFTGSWRDFTIGVSAAGEWSVAVNWGLNRSHASGDDDAIDFTVSHRLVPRMWRNGFQTSSPVRCLLRAMLHELAADLKQLGPNERVKTCCSKTAVEECWTLPETYAQALPSAR